MNDFSSDENKNEDELINNLIESHTKGLEGDGSQESENKSEPNEPPSEDMQKVLDEHKIEIAPKTYKKFVVNVNNEYVEFFENLAPNVRSKMINNFIKSEIENKSRNRRRKKAVKFIKHFLIVLLTIVIGFPVIFYLVNYSIKSTLNSYKYMQVNFERLYQQKHMK